MKKKFLYYVSIVVCLLTLSSCEKREVIETIPVKQEQQQSVTSKPSIDDLKKFIFEVTKVPTSQITYDEKTEKFSCLGVEQFSKQNLEIYYFNIKSNK